MCGIFFVQNFFNQDTLKKYKEFILENIKSYQTDFSKIFTGKRFNGVGSGIYDKHGVLNNLYKWLDKAVNPSKIRIIP